jgi:Domain of unknown function (DUF4367)
MNRHLDNKIKEALSEQQVEVPFMIKERIDHTLTVLKKNKSDSPIKKRSFKMPLWTKSIMSVAVCLLLILSTVYFILPEPNEQIGMKNGINQSKELEKVVESLPYKDEVVLITELPFEIKEILPVSRKVSGNTTQFEVTYTDKNKDGFVTLDVVNEQVEIKSDNLELVDVELENGKKAKFMDNGNVQIISWQDNTLAYKIVAAKDMKDPSQKYSKEELVEIANSQK